VSVTLTAARTAPWRSRQSWGNSITRAENRIWSVNVSGTPNMAPALISNARPITPSGLIDQLACADA